MIVTDEHKRAIATAFERGGDELGAKVRTYVLPEAQRPLAEIPSELGPLLEHCKSGGVIINAFEGNSAETPFRIKLIKQEISTNSRVGHAPGITDSMMTDGPMNVDWFDVANDGTILFRKSERISFKYAIDRKQVGERIGLTVLRKGRSLSLGIPLETAKVSYGYLVPRVRYETLPTYYIVGGLVFSPLTENYLKIWKKWSKVPTRLKTYYYQMVTAKNQEQKDVVVLIDVLPDEMNVGFVEFEDLTVAQVNGKEINSMEDLVAAFEENHEGKDHQIILEPYNREIVLSKKKLKERGQIILKKYKVPSDRSADLKRP